MRTPSMQIEEKYLKAETFLKVLENCTWLTHEKYTMSEGKDVFYTGVYVDDLILAGKDKAKRREELASEFDTKDLSCLLSRIRIKTG